MKIVLLTSDSAWHRALPHRFSQIPNVELAGIVVQEKSSTANADWIKRAALKQPRMLMSKIVQRLFLHEVNASIDTVAIKYFGENEAPRAWPDVPLFNVRDINGDEAVSEIKNLAPDLICVSGTKLIKQPVFDINPSRGLINLHTGISPFYKGGPNCTLWCLHNGEPQFIGSTIHALDLGIDSGALLMTAQTPVEAEDTLPDLVCKAVRTGHDAYVRVVTAMATGRELQPVKQEEIGTGRTYMTREWDAWKLARARRFVRSGALKKWVESGRSGADSVRLVDVVGA